VVNGGLPQAGNLTLHLERLQADLLALLPAAAAGACLLDPEFWRAEWNYTGADYQSASVARAAAGLPPGTPAAAVRAAAAAQYEAGARAFFEGSLRAVARWFPGCRAGIYAYPLNDWSFGGYEGPRAAAMRAENDALQWLWETSGALFPSIYLTSPRVSKYDGQTTAGYATSTVAEAVRCAAAGAGAPERTPAAAAAAAAARPTPAAAARRAAGVDGGAENSTRPLVLPMMWYVYDAFPRPAPGAPWALLSDDDTRDVAAAPAAAGADGLLVWGAVGAPPFAPQPLATYLAATLGPALNASFAAAEACARQRCSARGRCAPGGACACVPPASGPDCSARAHD
jgi:hypothetical protein